MTGQFKVALGCSISLHVGALVGMPVGVPAQFDVERSPTSLEVFLLAPRPESVATQPVAQPDPHQVAAEVPALPQLPEPSPETVTSAERPGAVTEVQPDYLRNPPPVYPTLARRLGYEGTVVLAVDVLPSGLVEATSVTSSSGYDLLDQAALRAVAAWRFTPAQRWHEPVASRVEIPIIFRLVADRLSARERSS